MPGNVLAPRDANTAIPAPTDAEMAANTKPSIMSMEYHRQVFQSKMKEAAEYVSPSRDSIVASSSIRTD